MEKKIKINDSVTIVNYGKIKHVPKNQTKERPDCVVCEGSVFYCIDVMPHLIGLRGIVRDSHTDPNTNLTTYTVDIDEHLMVLEEEQLEKLDYEIHFDMRKLKDIDVLNIVIAFVREEITELPHQEIIKKFDSFKNRILN